MNWKRLLGYQQGNTMQRLQAKYRDRLAAAKQVRNSAAQAKLTAAFGAAKRNVGRAEFAAKKNILQAKKTGKLDTKKEVRNAKAGKLPTTQASSAAVNWKRLLGYQQGNTMQRLQAKYRDRLAAAKQVRNSAAQAKLTAAFSAAKRNVGRAEFAAKKNAQSRAEEAKRRQLAAAPWQAVLGYARGDSMKIVQAKFNEAMKRARAQKDTILQKRLREALTQAKRDPGMKQAEQILKRKPEQVFKVRKGVNTKATVAQRYRQSRERALAGGRRNVAEALNVAWKKLEPRLPATVNQKAKTPIAAPRTAANRERVRQERLARRQGRRMQAFVQQLPLAKPPPVRPQLARPQPQLVYAYAGGGGRVR